MDFLDSIFLLTPFTETPLNICLTKYCPSFKDSLECAHSSALSKRGEKNMLSFGSDPLCRAQDGKRYRARRQQKLSKA